MDNRSLGEVVLGDGRLLLSFTGLILLLSGLFTIVQSWVGQFLPHDVEYLGLSASELANYSSGKINLFMFHDRVAFGGSIMAVGALYLWLCEFPLKQNQAWAWYLFLFSGIIGFGSFLTYLGYGYLDTWHGLATLILLAVFLVGLFQAYRRLPSKSIKDLFLSAEKIDLKSSYGWGKMLLLFTSFGLFAGGLTIMTVGMTTVFVPTDLEFMEITVCGLDELNENLVPLIAHDRASFGGGLATTGLLFFFCLRRGDPTVNLWQIVFIAMTFGFASALGVHFAVGYTDFFHLAPAYFGVWIFYLGISLTYSKMTKNPVTYGGK